MDEEKKVVEEVKETKPTKKGVNRKAFIARKLKDINNLSNKRLANFLAGQVLNNK